MRSQELEAVLKAFIKEHTPAGCRLEVTTDPFFEVYVLCHARDNTMGYRCCLEPFHKGRHADANRGMIEFEDPRD